MRRLILNALLGLLALSSAAQAQTFPVPGRPVTFIYGFPPGTPGDVYLRLAGPRISAALGVPVAVENRVGATGNIAAEAVARAPADGHTVVLTTTSLAAVNPLLLRMPIDPARDLLPVMRVFDAPNVLTVSTAQRPQYTDCRALMAALRARPGQLNYASSGAGASTHLAAAQFLQAAGLQVQHVPYRGGPPAMIALYQGEVEFFFYQSGTVIEDMRAGRVRILGITSAERHPQVPEVPTVAEACGMPGFVSTTWHGLMVPAGAPAGAVARLNEEFRKINAMPDIQQRLVSLGLTVLQGDPAEMAAATARDIAHWGEVVRRAGLRAE
ncbi:tripartite tricarboxylate transporter substrate binding protein [Roseococcus sp. SYP-B2431]|uniref:Bug family tripartite tricarboxylate transporter substrate binding protein n=1 Tax=Roseococcus sp. SYP-B2431 TaxID=2496640 RepID=UPI00103DB098|nr:tripartite tricarboxylate transporter substrate binding protein [Roseococcus sp. SYP-B2431]TCH99510.1 tripartite tricarboxylate transporter substrate binding protein [Roseococcus sp. SYP-B2431]